jgi:hypothetical protein
MKVTVIKALSGFFNVDTITEASDPALWKADGTGQNTHDDKLGFAYGSIQLSGKRRTTLWGAELKALTTEEKRELAELVVTETGDTL